MSSGLSTARLRRLHDVMASPVDAGALPVLIRRSTIEGPSKLDAVVSGCAPHEAALRASGRVIMQASLADPSVATSVRPRRGTMSVTDGPFAETKARVGAFFVVEPADPAEAVRVASMHPTANLGEQLGWGIEVRGIGQLVDS